MDENLGTKWPVKAAAPPNLNSRQWLASNIAGVVFLILALLQLFSFRDFSDNFNALGYGSSNLWAGTLIFAELWAAFGFFRVRLSWGFRAVSNWLAVGTALFWVLSAIRQVSQFNDTQIIIAGKSAVISNFFGSYLTQASSWWTVIEATVFLFLVLYAVEAIRSESRPASTVKVTRRK